MAGGNFTALIEKRSEFVTAAPAAEFFLGSTAVVSIDFDESRAAHQTNDNTGAFDKVSFTCNVRQA